MNGGVWGCAGNPLVSVAPYRLFALYHLKRLKARNTRTRTPPPSTATRAMAARPASGHARPRRPLCACARAPCGGRRPPARPAARGGGWGWG